MIEFNNISCDSPYMHFSAKYEEAYNADQKNIEAISISSYSKTLNEVNARYVNLKFIDNKDFIFFTNYKGPKSLEFKEHNQITALIYWNSIRYHPYSLSKTLAQGPINSLYLYLNDSKFPR